jgi:hypothetical protein
MLSKFKKNFGAFYGTTSDLLILLKDGLGDF